MAADWQESLRADARRNREQIIAAARAAFAARGLDVPMDEIAREARVGVGTLYRRFPDRDALVRAVAMDSIERILVEARAAAVEEPTAWQALTRLLNRLAELQLSVQFTMAPHAALAAMAGDAAIKRLRDDLLDQLDQLIVDAQRDGQLRADIGAGDLASLLALLLRPLPSRDPELTRLAAERCTAILIDGLRAHPGTPLPGRPLQRRDVGG